VGELRAYLALLGAQYRSLASYRASFVVELITNIGSTALDIITVLVLFGTARVVAGFTLSEAPWSHRWPGRCSSPRSSC
jgi:ABC-2 type transport system permease protein